MQIKRNSFTKEFLEILQQRYNVHLKPPKESYFSIINDILLRTFMNVKFECS
jgi:hypothetical protein